MVRQTIETLNEHRGILDALEQGDGKLAEVIARKHIRESTKFLEKQFELNKNK